mgnify:CR=1 FL=1
MPGRFSTSEICSNESNNSQFVVIKAEFPWGTEAVEVIKYLPDTLKSDSEFFEVPICLLINFKITFKKF